MSAPLPAWLTRAADGIRQLADRPWTLFCLLLAMNALARPCYATAHDAHLYSLQAINQAETGSYSDDVFLRFGSQDQFSIFSRVMGPIVAALGVRTAFFLGYLVGNTLFIFALFRLVRTFVDDPVIATLSLIYLVTAPLSYGGFDIFTVHEQFFTPRIFGMTFTLFALERMLRQHFVQAIVLLIAGSLLHPLMAFGGMMIWAGYLACTFLLMRVATGLLIAALLGGVAILSIPTVGVQVFGSMDADWHQMIRVAVGYNYPDTWTYKDWLNVAVSFAVPIAACVSLYRGDPDRQRFCAIVVLAGGIGLIATIAASFLPYALLFQAQPYRVLWILKVFQVPLGFVLIANWSCEPRARIAALGLFAFFCITHYLPHELAIIAVAAALSIGVNQLRDEKEPNAWWYAAARGLALGALAWMSYRCWFLIAERATVVSQFDFNEWLLFDMISPMFWLVGLCIALAWMEKPLAWRAVFASAAAVALVPPVALFAVEASPEFRREHTRLGGDVELVRDFITDHNHGSRRPTVYWGMDRADLVWTDVHANSYFSIIQTAGVMFNRQTAEEIDRRAGLVAKFEMARQRDMGVFLDDVKKVGMENLFKIPFNSPAPSREDLVRLCQEPGLDYVVIEQEFPGLFSASNGRVFIYECYKVKNSSSFSARSEGSGPPPPIVRGGR
jgi:hypothetical protein